MSLHLLRGSKVGQTFCRPTPGAQVIGGAYGDAGAHHNWLPSDDGVLVQNGACIDIRDQRRREVRVLAPLNDYYNPSLKESNMSKGHSLQDPFLNALRKERIPVSIFLVNGIKLQGQIESFDQFVILLKNTVSQMVYKHAISTVVPARNVKIPHDGDEVVTE